MHLASLDPFGEPALLDEMLPEPHERAVQDLRDAALGKVEDSSDLPQRKAFVIVEGGYYPLLLAEALYGPNQPRSNLGHLRGRRWVGRRVVPYEVVQPGSKTSLVLQAGFQRPHLRPRVLLEKRPMLGDADPESPDQLRLSRSAAQLLHEFVPGTLDLVRPHASPAREWIHLPQLIEYGPSNLGDRIRLELGAALWIVGHERGVVDNEPVPQSPRLTFGHPALNTRDLRFGQAFSDS